MRHFLPSPRRLSTVLAAGAVGVVAAASFGTPALACHSVIQVKQPICSTTTPGAVEVTWSLTSVPSGAVLSGIKVNAGTLTGAIKDKAVLSETSPLVGVQTLPISAGFAKLDGTLTWTSKVGKKTETHKWNLSQSNNTIKFGELQCGSSPTPPPTKPADKPSEVTFTPNCDSVVVTIKNPGTEARKYEITGVDEQVSVPGGEEKSVTITGGKVTGGAVVITEVTTKGKTVVGKKEWTPTPCESVTPSGSIIPSAVDSSSASGSLPVTGANAALISGAAVILLGAGAGMFIVARRRRVRFTA